MLLLEERIETFYESQFTDILIGAYVVRRQRVDVLKYSK